jgi:heme-degrading monooxygenase HmoA
MLFKLIVATVPNDLHAQFSEGQASAWRGLESVPGFVAQIGGWVDDRPDSAVIVGYWRSEQAYADFMREQHDSFANRQRDTYSALRVSAGHVILTIKEADPRVPIAEAGVVRISDITLREDSSPLFLAMQFDIWRPGLVSSGGMLGNTLSRLGRLPDRFASTTFWRSSDALQNFLQTVYPVLSAQAKLKDHVGEMVSYHVLLEPSWSVVAPLRSSQD